MLQCRENQLNCLRNIGRLAMIVPKLLTLRLQPGFVEFWTEMHKVAKAVNKQVDREYKLADLVSLRQQRPPSSAWAPFLCSEDSQAEELISSGWIPWQPYSLFFHYGLHCCHVDQP